jgi:hypothetical protein
MDNSYKKEGNMIGFLIFLATIAGSILFVSLQRKFSPETMIDGFMDYEKAKEIAPTIFTVKQKNEKRDTPSI